MRNNYEVIADGMYVTTEYKGTNLQEAIEAFKRVDESKWANAIIYINGEKVSFR